MCILFWGSCHWIHDAVSAEDVQESLASSAMLQIICEAELSIFSFVKCGNSFFFSTPCHTLMHIIDVNVYLSDSRFVLYFPVFGHLLFISSFTKTHGDFCPGKKLHSSAHNRIPLLPMVNFGTAVNKEPFWSGWTVIISIPRTSPRATTIIYFKFRVGHTLSVSFCRWWLNL